MKKILFVLMSLFVTASAFAEPFSFSNFYIDGFGGVNFVNSQEENNVRIELNSGYAVGGALGYRFSRFFRLEGEAAYRSNTFERVVVRDIPLPASGSIKKVTAMANGLIEIPILENTLIPYCGAGLGERWDRESFTLKPIHTEEGTLVFDKLEGRGQGFACQGIVGFTFLVGQKVQAALEYRYLDGFDIQGNHTVDLNLKKYF